MLKKLTAIMILGSVFAMSGCETVPSTSSVKTENNLQLLQNRTWIVNQIGNTEITTAPTARNIPSLQFDASTEMACLDNEGLDQKFKEALSKVTHYQVYGKTLKLMDRHGNLLIQLESAVQPR